MKTLLDLAVGDTLEQPEWLTVTQDMINQIYALSIRLMHRESDLCVINQIHAPAVFFHAP